MSEQTEGLTPQETTVSLKETASTLQRQQDSVFDGQNLRIGFLEKDEKGQDLPEDQRKQQAEKLTQRLNGLKDSQDNPILGRQITAKEIQELPYEIQKLISEGKLSGILVNILGNQPQDSEASALAMVVFLDYIKTNLEKPHQDLLREAYQRVNEVLKIAYPQAPQLLSFASSLIDKEGNLSAIVLGDQQITIFDKEGQKKGEAIKEEKEADGSPKIQTLKLEKGDKVFVCHKDKADQIDGTKGVKEAVDRLTKEKTDTSSAGAGEEEEENQESVSIPQTADAQEALRRLAGEGPIVVDDKDNQSETYTLDDFRKAIAPPQAGEDSRITQLREKIQKINQFLFDADVQKTLTEILPKKDEESDEQYRLRCLLAVKERLAKPGRFEKANDKLSVLLINKGFRSEVVTPQFLQALEGIYYLEIDKQNQEKLRLWEEARRQGRWDIATFISLQRGIVDIGGSIGVFEDTPEGRKRREAAERDMRAALLLTNAFASLPYETIVDPATGEKRTISFNEKMEPLLKARLKAKTYKEKEGISIIIEEEYKIYLQRLEEAMRKREWKVNPFGQDEIFQKEAWQQLQLLKPPFTQDKFDQLIELYKQNPSFKRLWEKARESTEKNIRETFGRDIGALPDFLGYAQKGIEFLERRMELLRIPKPEIEEIPQIIYPKKWVEVIEEPLQELDSILQTGRTVQKGIDEIRETEEDIIDRFKKSTEKESEGGIEKGQPDQIEPDILPGPPETPYSIDSAVPAPVEASAFFESKIDLPDQYNFAIVSSPERLEQEVGALAKHYRASKTPALGWKILLHPRAFVKNLWQNTFFSRIFDDQAIRFEMGLTEAVRRKLGIDSSVPIQLTPELMDKALEEGKKLKKQQSFWRKIGFAGRDLVANVLGIGQNSQMLLAREWLENQAPPEEINDLLTRSLKDQTDFAQRFALEEVGGLKAISEEIGETRFLLEERVHDPQLVGGLKGKIKELALAVCDGTKTSEVALAELNRYFKTEVYPHLPSDVQKELEGIELSSNLLALVGFLQKQDPTGKTYLQLYQEKQGKEQGKTKWDELDLKIYLGKGRYETARGDVELTGLQRKLIQRMMERNYAKENGFQFSDLPRAIELLKDIGIFGGSYLLGGLAGAKSFGRGIISGLLHLNPVTGTLAMSLTAGLREGPALARKGRLKGIAGKTWQDFVQVSRESAQGRVSQENARLRKQFEALLVDQRSATELTGAITQFIQKEDLTPDEQKQLLLAIAHAQARLKMTDLSTRRGKRILGIGDIEVPQNFITYNFDKRNEELTALRSAILDGAAKLSQINPELFGKLQGVQRVFEAQLRIGSVKEKLAGCISRENNISLDEANELVNQFFVDLGIREDKSLEASAERLAKLTWKRMGQTMAMSAVAGAVTKLTIQPILGEGINFYQDVQHAGGILKGLKEYSSEWGQVVHGEIPIEVDTHGNFVADLSPLQRGIIQGPYILHNLGLDRLFHTEIPPGETVNLGNAQIDMPSGYHFQKADYNHDGIVDTVLVNKAAGGEVVFGISGYHLGAVDVDGDGQLNLVLQDQRGNVLINPANGKSFLEESLQRKGINISSTENIIARNEVTTETIFSLPGGHHSEQVGSLTVQTPNGTHWVDNGNGTYDLVCQGTDGKLRVLINDAKIVDNQLVIAKIHPNFNYSITGNSLKIEKLVTGDEARGFWEKIVNQPGKQIWWTNATESSDYQELRLYNEVFKDGNGNLGIRFIGPTGQGSIDGVNFYQVDKYAQAHGGMQLSFVIPGLGHLRVDMSCDNKGSDNDFWLSTDNNNEVLSNGAPVIMPDGHHLTIAELAKMVINQKALQEHLHTEGISVSTNPISLNTEYRGWLDVFNLGNEEKNGFIVAGFTDDNGVFNHLAAIRGRNNLTAITITENKVVPTLNLNGSITGKITRTVNDRVTIFNLTAQLPRLSLSLPLFIPVRENIEKSVNNQISIRNGADSTQNTNRGENRVEERTQKRDSDVKATELSMEYKKDEKNISITGHSEKGGREKNEDAYFDGDFHFGTTLTDDQLKRIGVLEEGESLANLKDELDKSGLSVAIVADGMGGHGDGEVASAIATVGFIKELLKRSSIINEQVLNEIIKSVNQYIGRYNNLKGTNSGTTLVAQVTDSNGNTYVISIGDSRCYLVDEIRGFSYLLTEDQSLVWSLACEGGINPWEIFTNNRRNIISKSLSGDDRYQPQIYKLSLSKGQRLVLCCDGVWEGIEHSKITEELKNKFNKRVQKLKSQGKTEEDSRSIAMREFFGELFWQLNLGANIANLNPNYLARQEVGNLSGDNVTAVVVNFN